MRDREGGREATKARDIKRNIRSKCAYICVCMREKIGEAGGGREIKKRKSERVREIKH